MGKICWREFLAEEGWDIWFAWRPVTATAPDGKKTAVWMHQVVRKRTYDLLGDYVRAEYRLLTDPMFMNLTEEEIGRL